MVMYTAPNRTQKGYRYRNEKLAVIWATSMPQTDEAAYDYVEALIARGLKPVYLEKREAGESGFTPMPVMVVDGKVVEL